MRTVKMYEPNDEVYIRATVRSVVVDNGTIKYELRNKATGIDDKFLYEEEHIVPVEKTVVKTPVTKTPAAKKPTTKK